jgi:hypothetical protein
MDFGFMRGLFGSSARGAVPGAIDGPYASDAIPDYRITAPEAAVPAFDPAPANPNATNSYLGGLIKYQRPAGQTDAERTMLLGAMLKDVGSAFRGGDSDNVAETQAAIAKQRSRQAVAAAQEDIARFAAGQPIAPREAALPAYQPQDAASAPPDAPAEDIAADLGGSLGPTGSPISAPRIAGADLSASIPARSPVADAMGKQVNARNALPVLLAAAQKGVDITPYVALFKAAEPKIQYDRGFGYDQYGNPAGGFHPDLDKGQEPLYDAAGRLVGVRNLDGSVQSAAEMAGAVSGAQEQAKAALDLVKVPLKNGGSVMMPRLVAAERLMGQGPAAGGASPIVPPGSGPSSTPGEPEGFGVEQSPAEQTLATKRATTEAEREAAQPQEFAGLVDQDRASEITSDNIRTLLGDRRDPKTGEWVEGGGHSMLGPFTTGYGAILSAIPGSPAYDVKTRLEQIKAATGFDELSKMRQNSPTGGALGQVSEQENRLLQSVRGSVDQAQSDPQLRQTLRSQLQQLDKLRAQRRQLYSAKHGNTPAENPAPTRAAIEAEMRRRGLLH